MEDEILKLKNELSNLSRDFVAYKESRERLQLRRPLDPESRSLISEFSGASSGSSDVIVNVFAKDNTELASSAYKPFMICDAAYTVSSIEMSYMTACTDATSGMNVEKLTGTTAPGFGNKITSTPVDLKSTINTVYTASLDSTYTSLSDGDRIGLRVFGSWTNGAGLTVTVKLTKV